MSLIRVNINNILFECLNQSDLDKELSKYESPVVEYLPKLQAHINAEALAFLSETDWYVIRFMETGVQIPEDIKIKRQEARTRILND